MYLEQELQYSKAKSDELKESNRRLFVQFQFPIVDIRPLLIDQKGRLPSPSWPDPRAGIEFLRSTGIVQDRPRGPIRDWDGERSFVDASKLVKFSDEETRPRRVAYRRLYGSHLCYRIDIAFVAYADEDRAQGETTAALAKIDELARTKVTVEGRNEELSQAGVALRHAIWTRSTTAEHLSDHPRGRLTSGQSMILGEMGSRDVAETSLVLKASMNPRGTRTPIYLLSSNPDSNPAAQRRVRSALWRLNSELEVLREISRAWRAHPESFDKGRLLEYLEGATRHLVRQNRYGIDQGPIGALARQLSSFPTSELLTLLELTTSESKGIQRRLELILERTSNSIMADPDSLQLLVVDREINVYVNHETHMNVRQETNMGDKFIFNAAASGVFGSNNEVNTSSFSASWGADLEQSLKDIESKIQDLHSSDPELDLGTSSTVIESVIQAKQPRRVQKALDSIKSNLQGIGSAALPVLEAIRRTQELIN